MTPTIRHRHNTVLVDNAPLVTNSLQKTYLTSDVTASSGTLTVKNISGFAVNQVILIGELGNENSEIIKTHASTAPSGTTITLASNTAKAHSTGTVVYVLLYDQIEISHATTLTGSKSVLATNNIQADTVIQDYKDTSQTTGYYFARYKDSIATAFSGYSDGVIFDGHASNSVGYMIDRALQRSQATLTDVVTKDFCYDEINECIRFIQGKQVRWPEHYVYNSIAGQAQRGTNVLTMPTDAYDTETPRSVVGVRIGDGRNLRYLDPIAFDEYMGDVKFTQVRTEASANDTTLDVDNSYDFADSGTLAVYVSGTKDSFTYTGVTRDDATGGTAQFTGIPSSGDNAIGQTTVVDTYVWQDEEEGTPTIYTVRNGNLEYWPLVDAQHDNQNIYLDYATVVTEVDSDNDTVDFHRYDMVLDYLTWKVRMMSKNNGILDQNDGYYLAFKEKLNNAIRNSNSGIVFPMKPKINSMGRQPYPNNNRGLYSTDS